LRSAGGKQLADIASDILNYFLRNPTVIDSFDGIVRWRVLEEIVRRSVTETEDALHWLIAKGYLSEEKVPGRKSMYRLVPSKRADAERLVRETGEEEPHDEFSEPS
jgi:hypothetical protein